MVVGFSFSITCWSKPLTFFLYRLKLFGWGFPLKSKLFLSEDFNSVMTASAKIKQFSESKAEKCLGSFEIVVDLFSCCESVKTLLNCGSQSFR